jgi:hypothetical protein
MCSVDIYTKILIKIMSTMVADLLQRVWFLILIVVKDEKASLDLGLGSVLYIPSIRLRPPISYHGDFLTILTICALHNSRRPIKTSFSDTHSTGGRKYRGPDWDWNCIDRPTSMLALPQQNA